MQIKRQLVFITTAGQEKMEASFQGRGLRGQVLKLPEGFEGMVIDSVDDEQWQVTGTFDNLTYWNHDTMPSDGDQVCVALSHPPS